MEFDAKGYFEEIATRMKAIGHSESTPKFFTATNVMNLEGLLQSLTVAQYPAIVYFDKQDGRFEDRRSNNLEDRQFHQLLILTPAPVQDSAERGKAFDLCKGIMRRIISRMTRDWLAAQRGQDTTGLRNLDRNTMYYNSVGPLVDGLYGLELVFTLLEPFSTAYDADDWLDD